MPKSILEIKTSVIYKLVYKVHVIYVQRKPPERNKQYNVKIVLIQDKITFVLIIPLYLLIKHLKVFFKFLTDSLKIYLSTAHLCGLWWSKTFTVLNFTPRKCRKCKSLHLHFVIW